MQVASRWGCENEGARHASAKGLERKEGAGREVSGVKGVSARLACFFFLNEVKDNLDRFGVIRETSV